MTSAQLKILKSILKNKISTLKEDLKQHSGNQFSSKQFLPEAICFAKSEADVLALVNFCIAYKIPLIPFGSGTSVEDHITPIYGGICLNLSGMNKVLELNIKDSYVVVEPGIAYNKLNELLSPYGYHFPVEAGWGASIGGMVATNASGAGAVDAGSMAQNILGLSVVSYKKNHAYPFKTGTKSLKSSAGYNLSHLFVGSEGTLGIITQITLKIKRNSNHNMTLCAQFEEIQQVVNFVLNLKGSIRFKKIELLDKLQTDACINYSKISNLIANKNTLLIELSGYQKFVLEESKICERHLKMSHAENIQLYNDKKSAEHLWLMRKNAGPAAIAFLGKHKRAIVTDVSVPLSKLGDCINACYIHLNHLGLSAALVSHVGDGNFHFTIVIDSTSKMELQKVETFKNAIVSEALKVNGTCSGEHGIGIGKKSNLLAQHGDSIFAMQQIKHAFDPLNIFNPGKIHSDSSNSLSSEIEENQNVPRIHSCL